MDIESFLKRMKQKKNQEFYIFDRVQVFSFFFLGKNL